MSTLLGEQRGFSWEDFLCQLFPQICSGGDIAGTGSNPDDPEAPGEDSADDDVPDADTPGLYPAMTGNPDERGIQMNENHKSILKKPLTILIIHCQ